MKRLRIVPCGHKVLIKPDELVKGHKVEGTEIEIAIVHHNEDIHKASQISGKVVALGPDCWKAFRGVDDKGRWTNGKPWAGIGDQVYYSKHAGHMLEPNEGERFTLLNDEDINAIILLEEEE